MTTFDPSMVEYLLKQRDAYLAMVDNIERLLPEKFPIRTADLRKQEKRERGILAPKEQEHKT